MVQRPSRNKDKHRNICVFCGSSIGSDPAFAEAASKLGALIGKRGYRLIFGGGNIGLMGRVAEAAHAEGVKVHGIMPMFLRHLEPPLKHGETLEFTPDLQKRKWRMLKEADAFVILPGGLGTLDEFFEVLTSAQLGVFGKPIVVLNTKRYFEPLRKLIAHVIRHGFAREDAARLCHFVGTPEEAIEIVSQPPAPSAKKASLQARSTSKRPKRSRK